MALKLGLGSAFLVSHPSPLITPNKNLFFFLLRKNLEPSYSYSSVSFSGIAAPRASISGTPANGVANDESPLDDELISRASMLKDAGQVLELIIAGKSEQERNNNNNNNNVVSCSDCCRIISAALQRNNSDLALSVLAAMRSSSFHQVLRESGGFVGSWKWSRPDLRIYTTLVLGLAASLRVSDALQMVSDVCRVGAFPGEEVPFGKIVRCPTCLIAVAVAQPQQGIQIVSCAKCRYQYELISGDVVNIESEEIRISC